MTTSQTRLLNTELPVIQHYEILDNLNLIIDSTSPHHKSKSDSTVVGGASNTETHPQFIRRPGAVEVIEIGAKLRGRYDLLKKGVGSVADDVLTVCRSVATFEGNFNSFSDWLEVAAGTLEGAGPILPYSSDIKSKQQIIKVGNE